MSNTFKALVVEEKADSIFEKKITTRNISDLPNGEVLIKVHYSSLNYKDALSATGNKGITRNYPHTPGIDAAGIVVESLSPQFNIGDKVICTGYDLGMNTSGGFGQYIRVPASWIVPCPINISLRNAMIIGTAGFTAITGIMEIIKHNIKPNSGKIVVSGATGGVGIIAVMLLSKLGYEIIACSGKPEYCDLLKKIGASDVQGRDLLSEDSPKPLAVQKWVAAIDTVGGNVLTNIIKSTAMYGMVATCGNIVSTTLNTSIFPFILRGVRLIGLASAENPLSKKLEIWDYVSKEFTNIDFDLISKEVKLEGLLPEIDLILKGGQVGRVLVNMQ